jgi:hypothetical protein
MNSHYQYYNKGLSMIAFYENIVNKLLGLSYMSEIFIFINNN